MNASGSVSAVLNIVIATCVRTGYTLATNAWIRDAHRKLNTINVTVEKKGKIT